MKDLSYYLKLVNKELEKKVNSRTAYMVGRKFTEDLMYLFEAFEEVYGSESEFIDYKNELDYTTVFNNAHSGITTRKSFGAVQHKFVSKNQAYFLRVYSFLSSLSKLLTCLLHTGQVPISSNTKFLQFLSERFSHIDTQIDQLAKALEFRTYVDHPNQKKNILRG